MLTPKVSVVMSVYNDAKYVRCALDSILSQKNVDCEFIIVDDGSTDESPEILAQYAGRDRRIRLIRVANNGLTQALICGCNAARGEYIARQDSDDISLPSRLSTQAAILDANRNVVFVSCFSEVIAPGGEVVIQHTRPLGAEDATRMLLSDHVGPPGHGTVMFRSDAYRRVGGYRSEFYFSQDTDLWFRLAEIGMLQYCVCVLYQYRISPQSLSGRRGAIKACYANLVHKCRVARASGESEAFLLRECANLKKYSSNSSSESEATTLYFLGRNLLKSNPTIAAQYLIQCLWRSPFHFRALACLMVLPLSCLRLQCIRQTKRSFGSA